MKRKTSIGQLIYVGVACLLIFAVICAFVMVPSQYAEKEDKVEEYIDRVCFSLYGGDATDDILSEWYSKLGKKEGSASDMILSIMEKPVFTKQGLTSRSQIYSLIDVVYQTMVGHLPGEQEKSSAVTYMEGGMSIRYIMSGLCNDAEFIAICDQYGILPGKVEVFESRDMDPEVTFAVGELYYSIKEVHPDAGILNEMIDTFKNQDMSVLDFITKNSSDAKGKDKLKETIASMLLREVSESEMTEYEEMLAQGVSADYVIKRVSESDEFRQKWTSLGIVPGTIELTQPRDLNLELTSFLSRFYLCLAGREATEEELNLGISQVLDHELKIQTMLAEILDTPESQALLSDNEDFLDAIYEVLYGTKPDPEVVEGYLIGLNNGVLRSRILEEIAKDPKFDEQMKEYGFDTEKETVIPEKMVALTFDDGPYTPVTFRILDALEPYGGHATFFVIGNRVNNYSECVIRAVNQGCEIANHTWNHTSLPKISGDSVAQQMQDCDDAVYNLCGFHTRLMRPVGGAYNNTVAANVGRPMIIWSIDTNDWRYKNTQHVINEILDNVRDGDIVLMHDIYECTAEAMEYVIPELVARGYTLVTVSELAEYKGVELQAGEAYRSIRG